MAKKDHFDYIVVGAGSAGCVVANRLSEDENCEALLLEAGDWDTRPEIHSVDDSSIAALWGADWHREIDWGYETEPEPKLKDRRIPVARGKVIGGCSSVNALMWVRGNRSDYDSWPRQGAHGWSYEDVLPYFKKSEDFSLGQNFWRGSGGPISVWSHGVRPTSIAQAFIEATHELGHNAAGGDYNGDRQDGFGFIFQFTRTPEGRRCSSATGYLHPVLRRRNLTVSVLSQATRISFRNGVANSVEYVARGQLFNAKAREGVVLCGGTFETPKLLMLSGVGPEDQLQKQEVECIARSPEVGSNLQDHLLFDLVYTSESSGFVPRLLSNAGIFLHSGISVNPGEAPDLQVAFGAENIVGAEAGTTFAFHPILIKPASRGHVDLLSVDPTVPLKLHMNYLGEQSDIETALAAVDLVRKLSSTRTFARLGIEEVSPGAKMTGKDDLIDYVASQATTMWHPVGTCRMGSDVNSVVDPGLRVNGVENIWIADASVMPSIVSGNTNAATVMIGEKAADLIRNVCKNKLRSG